MLKSSFKRVLLRQPRLAIPKESNDPKDLFSIIDIRKGNKLYQIQDPIDLQRKIKDKNYTKRYFSEEIQEEFKIYGLALLGIEFLSFRAEINDLEEAQKIFDKSFYKKVQEYLHQSDYKQTVEANTEPVSTDEVVLKEWTSKNKKDSQK